MDDKDHTLCDLFETGRKITGDWNFLGTTTGEVRVNGEGGRARGRDRENKEEVGSTIIIKIIIIKINKTTIFLK